MWRSIAIISVAIRLSNPAVSEPTAESYATALRAVAGQRQIDPLTMVSIISFESAWNPSAEGRGVDIGLCQINIINLPPCREGRRAAGCAQAIARLKNPIYNIRFCGELITKQREFCRKYKRSRHAWFAEWLAQFQGRSPPGTYCLWKKRPQSLRRIGSRAKYKVRPHRFTSTVIAYRRCLIREIERGVRPGGRKRFRCQPWYGKPRGG